MVERCAHAVEQSVSTELARKDAVRIGITVVADVADHHRIALAEHLRERSERRPRRTVERIGSGPHRRRVAVRTDAVIGELIADERPGRVVAAVDRHHQDSRAELGFVVQSARDVHQLVGVEVARAESGELDVDLLGLEHGARLLVATQTRLGVERVAGSEWLDHLIGTRRPAVGERADDVTVEDLIESRCAIGWGGVGGGCRQHRSRKRCDGENHAECAASSVAAQHLWCVTHW
ncbi:Uncharacterised protein [Mycobacteroides abscessus subsp. abscessus]|nr:Uncharacterised protein [Mycobacteroides abscessus subsp. abscessus]